MSRWAAAALTAVETGCPVCRGKNPPCCWKPTDGFEAGMLVEVAQSAQRRYRGLRGRVASVNRREGEVGVLGPGIGNTDAHTPAWFKPDELLRP